MESGRFAGFFRNARFDKPGVLRGFWGFRPPFFMTPRTARRKGDFGDYLWVELQEPVRERQGLKGWDAGPDREFFYFFFSRARFFVKNFPESGKETSQFF